MIRRFPTPEPVARLAARRGELGRLFAAEGLLPPPAEGGAPALGERLAAALAAAGPVLASYGRYLATRADVLPAAACLALAGIADRAPALDRDRVLLHLGRELGGDPWTTLRTLDLEPRASRLLTQEHRAVAGDGTPVVLVLLRPGIVDEADVDLELLPLLDPVLAALAPAARPEELAAGFRRALAAALDLQAQAALLAALAAEAPELLAVPAVVAGLTTRRLLVRQDLGGRRLDELAAGADPLAAATAAPSPLRAAVRRVCLLWLRQAFLGRTVPAEPRHDEVEVLPDGRVAFVGGVPAAPPPAVQEHLWAHLVGTAAQDPVAAGDALLRETERLPGAVDEAELMLRLRQVVPFRDGAWSVGGDSLPEHLFAGWRLAAEGGYRLRPAALEVARGIAALAALARRAVPGDDPLLAAVEELRLVRGLGRLREAVDPRTLGRDALPYAELLLAMPQKLDALLTSLASGDVRLRLEAAEPAGRGEGNRGTLLVAAVAAALALGLAVGRLAGPAGLAVEELAGGWGALLLLATGGLALRLLSRSG